MWPFKKIEKEETSPTPTVEEKPAPKKEESKPTTREAVMKIHAINNRTNYIRIIESDNDFGLSWKRPFDNNHKVTYISIRQNDSVNEDKWHVIAELQDFSLINIEWETFDIPSDDIRPIPQW
jgi:hypothetical protein